MSGGPFKLVASDLDGTLLRSDDTFSERTRRALSSARGAGIEVVLVTARSPAGLREEAAKLGVELAVCCNGGVTYDFAAEAVVAERVIDALLVRRLVEVLREEAPGVAFGWEHTEGFGAETHYVPLFAPPDQVPRADVLGLDGVPIRKLVFQHPDWTQEELHELALRVCGEEAVATYSGARLVEIAAAGVTKASAVAELCHEREIDPSQVIAFGDMPNDVPMLGWAGHGVAVANAHPHAIAAADEVTASNDEDGVALVLERVLAVA